VEIVNVKTTLTVDVDKLNQALDLLNAINSIPLENIIWKRGNYTLTASNGMALDDWRFTGLNNVTWYQTQMRDADD
jgi:hypothetical protein